MTNETFKDIEKLESDLWEAADNLRANSKLTSSDYFMPVLGVIFLQKGLKALSREDIERICREEGLWVGRTMEEPDALRVGIRSFCGEWGTPLNNSV